MATRVVWPRAPETSWRQDSSRRATLRPAMPLFETLLDAVGCDLMIDLGLCARHRLLHETRR